MRVLHVITGLGIGGAELQLRLLLRHLPAECEVVTLTNPGPVADAIAADGVRVVHLGMSGNRDLGALPRLARVIRDGRYDVVHTHLYRACVYGRTAARLARVRAVVATEHSLGASQIEGRPLTAPTRALYRITEKLGAGTLAVSETVARRLENWGVPASRVHLAPNGIDPQAFRFSAQVRASTRARLAIPQDAYVVGGVGRQVRGKHFDTLVRAVAANKDVHLLLAGDGPERVPLLRIVHQLGAAGRVHFTGPDQDPVPYTPEVPELLAAMDLFVSPSPEEAFGLAVVEALAAGLPTLYVNCPALEDLPPQDAPGAHQVAAHELPSVIRREHLAGPRRLPVPAAVERYHIARTAEAVMALYTAVSAPLPAAPRTGPLPEGISAPAAETATGGVPAPARAAAAPAPGAAPAPAPAPAPGGTSQGIPAPAAESAPGSEPAHAAAPVSAPASAPPGGAPKQAPDGASAPEPAPAPDTAADAPHADAPDSVPGPAADAVVAAATTEGATLAPAEK
jgi:glycosyltransferase involved in cell wall biosynthesis